ncbi:MAG: hypothetical protein ABJA57_12465 [Ginsengibacter sp.]
MRHIPIFSILLFFAFLGCNKNKYKTVPSLKYKSVNTTELHRGETLKFTLSFTDAEGDLSDSLTVKKVVSPCPSGFNGSFVQPYKLPEFPSGKNQQGDIIVQFDYNDINPKCLARNDTAVFKFVLKDKAQNKSDTAVSDPIVIVQ